MKKLLFILSIIFIMTSCGEDDPQPSQTAVQATVTPQANAPQPNTPTPTVDHTNDVKFTLYSNRVPYIWKRVVNGNWVQDSIKTNDAVVYEPYDTRNMGVGYFVTMNTSGKQTDSLHIKAEYQGRSAEMASVKLQSFAYVKLDDLK